MEISKSDIENYYNNKNIYIKLCDEKSFIRKMYIDEKKWKIKYMSKLVSEKDNINKVLDIGCATGDFLYIFPFGNEKMGIDICKKNIEFARKKYPEIQFACCDFSEFKSEEQYDVVILSEVLEHIINDEKLLEFAVNHAKIVLINVPLENELEKRIEYGLNKHNDGHLRGYTKNTIIDLIKKVNGKIISDKIIRLNKSWLIYKQCIQKIIRNISLNTIRKEIKFIYNNNIPRSYIIIVEKNNKGDEKFEQTKN